MNRRTFACIGVVLSLCLAAPSWARLSGSSESKPKFPGGPNRVLVIDGSTVHNVGELQMHLTNFGNFGSWPGTALPFAEQPSAQWPAGGGVEYLFTAGVWIGALKSGVPAVTTAAFAFELLPSQDTRDIMYRAAEGDRGGSRAPS